MFLSQPQLLTKSYLLLFKFLEIAHVIELLLFLTTTPPQELSPASRFFDAHTPDFKKTCLIKVFDFLYVLYTIFLLSFEMFNVDVTSNTILEQSGFLTL